jgi:F-type H+-transporting ATPase subunit delta
MSNRSVARRYARALFELEQEGVKLRESLNAAAEVARVDEVRELLAEPRFSAEDKASALVKATEAALGGKVAPEIARLIGLLAERGKAELLPEIADLVEEMARAAASELEARVVSAVKLDAETKQKVAAALSKALGGKVRLSTEVDPSILGGLVIRVGDRQLDYSLRTRLQSLKRAIVAS